MNDQGQATVEPSTVEERRALRLRRLHEARPMKMTAREVEVLHDLLTLAETALAGAGIRRLPE